MTVPDPEPLAPAVIVSQLSLLVAVQEHPAPTVTPTLPLLAMEATDALEAEIENLRRHNAKNITPLRPHNVA